MITRGEVDELAAAVERVAEAIYMTGNAGDDTHWDDIGRQRQEWFRSRARIVIAAFKGDGAWQTR